MTVTLDETQILFMLCMFGLALYHTWKTASEKAYDQGYFEGCYDVETGRVKVEIKEEE